MYTYILLWKCIAIEWPRFQLSSGIHLGGIREDSQGTTSTLLVPVFWPRLEFGKQNVFKNTDHEVILFNFQSTEKIIIRMAGRGIERGSFWCWNANLKVKVKVPLFILDNPNNYLSCSPLRSSKRYYRRKPEYPEKTGNAGRFIDVNDSYSEIQLISLVILPT